LKPEHLRSSQIEHQLVFRRQLHWKVTWPFPPQNAVDVGSG
jgi:hypothetical protein